jgi:hypothetical protein
MRQAEFAAPPAASRLVHWFEFAMFRIRDGRRRNLNLFERVQHILRIATYARQHVVFEIPRTRRRFTGKAEWCVPLPHDILLSYRKKTGQ